MVKKNLLILVLLIIVNTIVDRAYPQSTISGIINQYTIVDSVYPSKDTIVVTNPSIFSADDTVMVYQVKGAVVRKDTTSDGTRHLFGNVDATGLNNAGKYEIICVDNIQGNRVVFKLPLENNYDADDIVQLITVPSFENVRVNSELTCKNWIDSTGGVLVFMVSDTLFLNANINVTGTGFRGATPILTNIECGITSPSIYRSYYFDESTILSTGFKGESIAKFESGYRKGLGRWANGGGAANGRFSGAGGGGNGGNGGVGGSEDITVCNQNVFRLIPPNEQRSIGGDDGFGLSLRVNSRTIFLGGGGGAGTYASSFVASNGGNGGGIVIIIASNIKTNGYQIRANGNSVSEYTPTPFNISNISTASAGGGGGGGAIVFDVDTVLGSLSLLTNGGGGGFVQNTNIAGPGGGGGGGIIFWKTNRPDNVNISINGGSSGFIATGYPGSEDNYNASEGGIGSTYLNTMVPLTGFLFNRISESQDICSGMTPSLFEGSTLRGGTGTYTYQWQDSTDGGSWSDITGATEPNYQAPSLTDTTYYRRVATSGTIIDRGNVIRINVQNLITNNIITGADLITCINNEAAVITGTTVSVGGDNVNYEYVWQFKEDDTDWNTITNSQNTNTSFYPGTITDTSFVRRIVISGACRDTVSPGLEITGLPQIENNQINAIDEICYGEIPSEITGSLPIKGIGTYTYQWQQKNTNTAWTDINLATQQNYSPSNLYDTTIYRRLVYSDDCIDESDPDTVIVLSPITNNNIAISSPNSTCYNTPKQIDATLPAGAKNVYQYQWQESSDGSTWIDITNNANEQNYLSYNLTNRTFFRRHITSGACESISTNVQININPLPIAILNDFADTVCGESDVPIVVNITGGTPTYSIVYTDGNENYQQTGLSENQNTITINPNTLQESETLNYSIIAVQDQNGCLATDITGSGDIYVYGNPNANPGINAENCSFIFQMQAVPSLGNGVWSIIDQPTATSSVFENNLQANTNVTVNEAGMYTYQWKETNWQCVDSANVSINFYEQLQNVDAGEKIVKLFYTDKHTFNGNYTNPDNQAEVVSVWAKISENGTAEILNPNEKTTDVINIFDDKNQGLLFTWTVQKGVCPQFIDTTTIKLEEIFTPTGFSPNGDGINDRLKFLGLENAKSNELIIYNRWGTEVFRKKDFSNTEGWDGKNNRGKDLPEDTYFYILKVINKKDLEDNYKGYIVIKKY